MLRGYDFKGREDAAIAYIKRIAGSNPVRNPFAWYLEMALECPGSEIQLQNPGGRDLFVTAIRTETEVLYEIRLG